MAFVRCTVRATAAARRRMSRWRRGRREYAWPAAYKQVCPQKGPPVEYSLRAGPKRQRHGREIAASSLPAAQLIAATGSPPPSGRSPRLGRPCPPRGLGSASMLRTKKKSQPQPRSPSDQTTPAPPRHPTLHRTPVQPRPGCSGDDAARTSGPCDNHLQKKTRGSAPRAPRLLNPPDGQNSLNRR